MEPGLGGLGIKWKKARGFTYGFAAALVTTKYITPGIKNWLEAYKQKRKLARTLKDQREAEAFRKQLMGAAPELFTQQPGMPSPAEIQAAVAAAAPGQPIPIQVVEDERAVMRPAGVPAEVAPPPVAKPAIPKPLMYTMIGLSAAKIFGII